MKQKRKHLEIILKVRRWKFGEAVLEVNGWNRALHQAPSLCRDGFGVMQLLTFISVGGEDGVEEHGILNSGGSFKIF